MCPECFEKLEFNDFSASRIINSVDIYCAGVYTKELQKLIRGLKYHNQRDLAYYQAKFMYDYFLNLDVLKGKDFELVPVPQHKKRVKQRKYNHMELVCIEFSKLTGFKCNFELIKRVKDTKPQYKLNKQERMKNLAQAFIVNKEAYNNKTLLILDDICTTGSTFEEMINTFKNNGIENLVCMSTSTPL